MIYINNKPLIASEELKSEIILTDSGLCGKSRAYMLAKDAPGAKTKATLQIRNRYYIPNNPELPSGPANEVPGAGGGPSLTPFWLIFQDIWVETLYTMETPRTPVLDAEGDPVLDENDEPVFGFFPDLNKITMVEFYEYKYVLQEHIQYTNLYRNNYPEATGGGENPFRTLFQTAFPTSEWQNVFEVFSVEDLFIADANQSFVDPREQPFPLETPELLGWSGLTKLDCLYDFVYSLGYRLVTKTHALLDDDELPITKTELIFKERNPLQYDERINYENLIWPIIDGQYLALEQTHPLLSPYYPKFNNAFTPDVINLIKKAKNNLFCNYAFECSDLPYDFYETAEWSQITISYGLQGMRFLVEHFDRGTQYPLTSALHPNTNYTMKFRGFVESLTNDEMYVTDLRSADGQKELDSIALPGNFDQFQNEDQEGITTIPTIVEISMSQYGGYTYSFVETQIPYAAQMFHLGQEVESITYTMVGLPDTLPTDLFHFSNGLKLSVAAYNKTNFTPHILGGIPERGAFRRTIDPQGLDQTSINLVLDMTTAEIIAMFESDNPSFVSSDDPQFTSYAVEYIRKMFAVVPLTYRVNLGSTTFNWSVKTEETSLGTNRYVFFPRLEEGNGGIDLFTSVTKPATAVPAKPFITLFNPTVSSLASFKTQLGNYFRDYLASFETTIQATPAP